ncbi:hypothetical protein LEP1GSC074_3547 [Leptospira noguchii str. Hook]|nr:hypothetical protein LEP1GSC074_3547 [Leptospira noguchii str. Hook]
MWSLSLGNSIVFFSGAILLRIVRVPTIPPDYKLCVSSHNSTGLQTL